MPTVVGVFAGRQETETAIDQLAELGIDPDALGVVWREKSVSRPEELEVTVYVDHFDDPAAEARKGAIGGAVGGTAAGLGSVFLATAAGVVISSPIGLLLAGGTLAAAAVAGTVGAVGGSITGGLLGALLGATDHDATKVTRRDVEYREAIERDGFIVTIDTTEEALDHTVAALESAGATEISVLREHEFPPRTVHLRHDE